ncbi:MAG TPA: hypothetical protein VIL46_04400 [Gemmataceae bacterium]
MAEGVAVGHFKWLAVLILLLRAGLVLELAHGRVGLPPGSVWEWYATVEFLHFAPGAVRAVLRLLGRADARSAANSR